MVDSFIKGLVSAMKSVPARNLDELWNKVNINNNGSSADVIDKNEANEYINSIYFVEEGMNKETFKKKNEAIFELNKINTDLDSFADYAPKMGMGNTAGLKTEVVSKIVKEMIANGEFDNKKEVILGKFIYLDDATQLQVLEKLTPQEQNEALSSLPPETQDVLKVKLSTIKELENEQKEQEKQKQESDVHFGLD